MTSADDELEAEVQEALAPAIEDWWRGVLAVERAYEPEPPEVIRRMRANGLIDPEDEQGPSAHTRPDC